MNNQKRMAKFLTWVFALAGLGWIIGTFTSMTHFILFPLIGLVNLGIAYACKTMSD